MTIQLLPHEATELEAATWDVTPRITPARVRPFVFAILLLRAAVRAEEVIASLAPHAHPDDLRDFSEVDDEEQGTGLEICVARTLQELVDVEILRLRGDGLFVLTSNRAALARAISVVAATDGQLPDHLLSDLDDQARLRILSSL